MYILCVFTLYTTMTVLEIEEPMVDVNGEIFHVHSESDVKVVGEVIIKIPRDRPRKYKPSLEKRPRG